VAAFVRYVVAGSLAFATHLAVLEALMRLAGTVPWLATTVGFVLACVVNYSLQHAWVFRSARPHLAAGPRYIAVTLVMLGVNAALFSLLHGRAGLPPALAQALTTGGVFVLNFLCNRRFTFARPQMPSEGMWQPVSASGGSTFSPGTSSRTS